MASQLPDEVLLQILHYLPKSVKYPKPQADLLNALSTCKQLAPLVREVLFCAPILYSSKVDQFLASLFQYPDLRYKIRSLTIETEIRGMCIGPNPIPALDSELLSKAISHISTLDIDPLTKQHFTESLHAGNEYDGPSILLSLVLTMLPNLQELYLGGSILYNFPFLQPLLYHSSLFPAHTPDLGPLLPLFSHKLTVLELPNDFRTSPSSGSNHRGSVHSIPKYSPSLRTLMLPSDNIIHAYYKRIVPSKLEHLILTDCLGKKAERWVKHVARVKTTLFPNLARVSLYHCCPGYAARMASRDLMKEMGILCKFSSRSRFRGRRFSNSV